MNNYFVFHLHSDLSVKDSTTKFEEYIKKAKELDMKGLCFSEHGNVYNWVKKKQACEKNDLKFVFGIECYLTESLVDKKRDNFHTILIARNWKGVQELLSAITKSSDKEHMYYSPRITFDEFLNFSDNIISTSACLGSPLNKLDESNPYFDRLCKKYNYFEIQANNTKDQKEFNLKLLDLSKKYNKPLVAGTDTHEINEYKQECRAILKSAKKRNYEDEDSYDLTFKTYKQLLSMFRTQNCLDESVYMEAIDNTNKILEDVDDFELDYSHKYPEFYDNEVEFFKNFIKDKLNEKIKSGAIVDSKELRDKIDYEFTVFKKQGMCSFMSFTGELTNWCWKEGIPIGDGRGSVNGSIIAYILDITDVDSLKWGTNFSRFCNEDRISLGDIDLDFYGEDRPRVFNYIEKRFGENKTCRIITFGTIAEKGCIEEICRGLKGKDGRRIYDDKKMDNIKVEFEKEGNSVKKGKFLYPTIEFIKKYEDLFYYYDGLIGTIIRTGFHPAGILGSPITLNDNLGLFYDKKNEIWISQCNMKEVDSLNYVKFDILGLRNIGILKGVSELLNERYKKSYEINWKDSKVWSDMKTSPIGIFQMESDTAFDSMKKYNVKSIDDLSFINSLIRPACESFRDKALNHEKNELPNKELESILGNTMNFLTFQEQILEFLHKFCGYTMSQADTIRRAIGKKDPETIKKLLPEIRDGYIQNRSIDKECASEEFEEFYKVIDDASSYGFSRNHSTPYSMIGYRCAMQRYYHTAEFVASYLNTANDMNDIEDGTKLAKEYGIKINPITIGVSDSKYTVKSGEVYKGMKSVAFINSKIPKEINSLNLNRKPSRVLKDIWLNTSTDSRQFKILCKIGYFKEFAKSRKLITFFNYLDILTDKKTFSKEKIDKKLEKYLIYGEYYDNIYIQNKRVKNEFITDDMEIIKQSAKTSLVNYYEKVRVLPYCEETDKLYKNVDVNKVLDIIWNDLPDQDFDMITKFQHELEYLGYIQTEIPKGTFIFDVKFSGKSKAGNVGAWLISKRNNKGAWFTFSKELSLPPKESIIIAHSIDVKEYKDRKSYKILEYNIIKE